MIRRLKSALADYIKDRIKHPSMRATLRRLSSCGFTPRHVADVGAYEGEFAALVRSVWPETAISCFEPQPDKCRIMQTKFAADGRIAVFNELLAAQSGQELELSLVETASSVLKEHTTQHGNSLKLRSLTIDDWCRKQQGQAPDLLKLDVQGYELEVLKGAESSLAGIEAIIAEVNFLDIHVGVPLLHDITAWLQQRGFVAHDICGLTRRPLDDALWQADFLFVKTDGWFRSDKRWGR